MKLSDIRYMIEQDVKEPIENADVVQWSNQVNADIAVNINVPATATIALTTTVLEYPEPVGMKVINRLWLKSDHDNGLDRQFTWPYRRYNGKIILQRPFYQTDTLNVDFYKQLTYFTDISNAIDLEDRNASLYAFYGIAKHKGKDTETDTAYQNMKRQVISLYAIASEPAVLEERW